MKTECVIVERPGCPVSKAPSNAAFLSRATWVDPSLCRKCELQNVIFDTHTPGELGGHGAVVQVQFDDVVPPQLL